jgi:hypothetical protein
MYKKKKELEPNKSYIRTINLLLKFANIQTENQRSEEIVTENDFSSCYYF